MKGGATQRLQGREEISICKTQMEFCIHQHVHKFHALAIRTEYELMSLLSSCWVLVVIPYLQISLSTRSTQFVVSINFWSFSLAHVKAYAKKS